MVRIDQSKHFVLCECGCEGIYVEHIKECDDTYLAIFSHGFRGAPWHMSLKEKLRSVWHILRTGSVYADQICLNTVSRMTLIDALKAMELIDDGSSGT